MATVKGDSGVIRIGSNDVGEVTSFSINETADRIEDTALGDTNRTYKAGLAEVTGTLEAWYDSSEQAGTTGQGALKTVGSTVSLSLRPEGTGTGLPEWTVSAQITEIVTEIAFNEIVRTNFNWAAAGTLTKATQ